MKLPLSALVLSLLVAPTVDAQVSATLTGTCPGTMTLDVSGATPNGPVAIAYGFTTGSYTVPGGACGGMVIGLVAPTLLTVLNADAAGNLSLTRNAPAGLCAGYALVADIVSCTPSLPAPLTPPPSVTYDFPSAASAVVGSVVGPTGPGAEYVGYFWSNVRGDMVSEQFAGPASISQVDLQIDVVNNLTVTPIDWEVVINGTSVGNFNCNPGQVLISETLNFAPVAGPNYNVVLRVNNLIPGGGGSNALRFTGAGAHQITLQ